MWEAVNNPTVWFFFGIATAVSFTYWNSEKYRLQEVAYSSYIRLIETYKVKLPEELENSLEQQSQIAQQDIVEADKRAIWSALGFLICIFLFYGST